MCAIVKTVSLSPYILIFIRVEFNMASNLIKVYMCSKIDSNIQGRRTGGNSGNK